MELSSLKDIQPYLSLVATVLSVATLGFVLKLSLSMRQAARDRTEVIEERHINVVADLERTEKWSEREKVQLAKENQQLQKDLEKVLAESGMTVEALAMGKTLEGATETIQSAVRELIIRMESVGKGAPLTEGPNWHLQLAIGYMSRREWAKAAEHFDKYCGLDPLNSDIQFSRGVAHANTRGGPAANIRALRAYNEAIAFADESLKTNLRARNFAYRGAMLKRLRRLEEARADLDVALKYANRSFEINDITYNLAGVYAMLGNREKMLEMVRLLSGCKKELNGIRHHLNDYFRDFASDEEFLSIIGTV